MIARQLPVPGTFIVNSHDSKINFPIHHDNPFKRKAVNEFDTAD